MMKRFFDPYYTLNSLLLLSYVLVRWYFLHLTPDGSPYSRHKSTREFVAWEKQVVTIMVAVLLWKGLRRRSMDHLAQQLFFFGHVVTALTAFMVDWRLLIWYGLVWWASCAAAPQPLQLKAAAKGQDAAGQDEQVVELNPDWFKEHVLRGDGTWLVYFYTEHHEPSTAMAPAFAELAAKYASDSLRCGCLDVGMWPRFAKDLKISTQTWSNQLPATVLYHKGQEVSRIPAASQIDDWGIKRNFYTKADIIKKFGLSDSGAYLTQKTGANRSSKKSSALTIKQK